MANEENALDMFLRAMADMDYDDQYRSVGEVKTSYNREVVVKHRYGRVFLEIRESREGGAAFSARLTLEEARQLALMLTENIGS